MAEKFMKSFAEAVKEMIPVKQGEEAVIQEKENSISVTADMDIGIKGMNVTVECSASTVKIKGSRDYAYPIAEAAADKFQQEIFKKYSGCSIYSSGQTLSFSKFFAYQTITEAEKETKKALEIMQDAVLTFEDECVNFLEKESGAQQEEEYNPEENVDIVHVDNTFHAVSTTEQDNTEYNNEHQNFAETVFAGLEKYGKRDGNEIIGEDKETGNTIRCVLFTMDAEILVSVSKTVPNDIGAMYVSYIRANYPELLSAYNADKELFTIRMYSSPDKFAPEETEEYLELCKKAMASCVKEYETTLQKKDSVDFASNVQQILAEQTETVAEREKTVTKRELEMAKREKEMLERESELKSQLDAMEQEKASMKKEIEEERARIQQHEAEMQEKIKSYEERNTKDIMNIQQLANQVAALQNRQSAIGSGGDEAEEEIFRLKSKVGQLTSQKIALEKKLTEKITAKEGKIRQLSDVITGKEAEIRKIEGTIDDMVQSKVTEASKKSQEYIAGLEKRVAEIGHILTPDDVMEYLKEFSDCEPTKRHASTAEFVVYTDGALDIRIRFGETNYVDVSREAVLKDQILRKLNTKYPDFKFSSKDNRITARGYFKKNAKPEEVDELIENLAANFTK